MYTAHHVTFSGLMKVSKQVKTDKQSLAGNFNYEHIIQARVADALKSNDYMKGFKRLNFKLNLCIGLFILKILLDVGGSSYFFN